MRSKGSLKLAVKVKRFKVSGKVLKSNVARGQQKMSADVFGGAKVGCIKIVW